MKIKPRLATLCCHVEFCHRHLYFHRVNTALIANVLRFDACIFVEIANASQTQPSEILRKNEIIKDLLASIKGQMTLKIGHKHRMDRRHIAIHPLEWNECVLFVSPPIGMLVEFAFAHRHRLRNRIHNESHVNDTYCFICTATPGHDGQKWKKSNHDSTDRSTSLARSTYLVCLRNKWPKTGRSLTAQLAIVVLRSIRGKETSFYGLHTTEYKHWNFTMARRMSSVATIQPINALASIVTQQQQQSVFRVFDAHFACIC